jgi:hypothetical protein
MCSNSISFEIVAILTEIRGSSQSSQPIAGLVPRLDHGHFLPHHFQFIIRLSFHHSMPYGSSLDSESVVN